MVCTRDGILLSHKKERGRATLDTEGIVSCSEVYSTHSSYFPFNTQFKSASVREIR